MTPPMTPSDRDPDASEAAAGVVPPAEPAPPAPPAEAATPDPAAPEPPGPKDEAPSAWLASSEGLVPVVPRHRRQWTPEPEADPDLEFTSTRLQPPPPTAEDD